MAVSFFLLFQAFIYTQDDALPCSLCHCPPGTLSELSFTVRIDKKKIASLPLTIGPLYAGSSLAERQDGLMKTMKLLAGQERVACSHHPAGSKLLF
jgi:hypothetical protein